MHSPRSASASRLHLNRSRLRGKQRGMTSGWLSIIKGTWKLDLNSYHEHKVESGYARLLQSDWIDTFNWDYHVCLIDGNRFERE